MIVNEDRDLVTLKMVVDQWMKTYEKKIQLRKHENNLYVLDSLPDKNDVACFDASEHCKQAVILLEASEDRVSAPTRGEFCLVRDYLIASLALDNAARPAGLYNMTLQNFRNASLISNMYVVSTLRHKTDSSCGPAMMAISPSQHAHLNLFINNMRNQIPGKAMSAIPPFC